MDSPSPPRYTDSELRILLEVRRLVEAYFRDDRTILPNALDDGWVPIPCIAGLREVKELTSNFWLIISALRVSEILEIDIENYKVKRKNDCSDYMVDRKKDDKGITQKKGQFKWFSRSKSKKSVMIQQVSAPPATMQQLSAPPAMMGPPRPMMMPPQPPAPTSNLSAGMPNIPEYPILSEVTFGNLVFLINYYFSDENLKKDTRLLKAMDAEGWVCVFTIALFEGVRSITGDMVSIMRAIEYAETVELKAYKIRRIQDWDKWLPTESERVKKKDEKNKWIKWFTPSKTKEPSKTYTGSLRYEDRKDYHHGLNSDSFRDDDIGTHAAYHQQATRRRQGSSERMYIEPIPMQNFELASETFGVDKGKNKMHGGGSSSMSYRGRSKWE